MQVLKWDHLKREPKRDSLSGLDCSFKQEIQMERPSYENDTTAVFHPPSSGAESNYSRIAPGPCSGGLQTSFFFLSGGACMRWWLAWLPDGYSQILRSYVFGPLGFWTMALLRYAAKFDPFLSLDCPPRNPSNPRKGKDEILPSGNLGG